jgi:hypothetical protein
LENQTLSPVPPQNKPKKPQFIIAAVCGFFVSMGFELPVVFCQQSVSPGDNWAEFLDSRVSLSQCRVEVHLSSHTKAIHNLPWFVLTTCTGPQGEL